MLMSVGPLVFDLQNNIESFSIDAREDFARKDVVGARKPFEHMGPGDESMTLRGKLFPEKLGGAGAVDALLRLKETGTPQMVVRGDGKVYGWHVITAVRSENTWLNRQGAPRMIEVEVTLEKTEAPSAASAFGSMLSLFG